MLLRDLLERIGLTIRSVIGVALDRPFALDDEEISKVGALLFVQFPYLPYDSSCIHQVQYPPRTHLFLSAIYNMQIYFVRFVNVWISNLNITPSTGDIGEHLRAASSRMAHKIP